MRTITEVEQWIGDALYELRDPAEFVCQIFCRWLEPVASYRGNELAAGMIDGAVCVRLRPGIFLPLPITGYGEPRGLDDEGLCRYEAVLITRGVWEIQPSLNIPGTIHGFLTFYDVPGEAPWHRRITVVGSQSMRAAIAGMRRQR